MKLRSYLHAAFGTTLNIILYALTLGRFLWLEGRVRGGIFHNWDHNFRYRPRRFARPKTEEELVELVRNSEDMERLHGANFDAFRQVCVQQDPARKFANVFTRRLFWD